MKTEARHIYDEEHILPYFQPIVGADQRTIVGYEILGRYRSGDHVISLGPFFHQATVEKERKQRVDRHIRTKALKMIDHHAGLRKSYFFNLDSAIFTEEEDELFYRQLTALLDTNREFKPFQFVLEITETDFSANVSAFLERLQKYRQLGCRIAVDDLGKGFSNLERVALLHPHIMKVDLNLVKKSADSQSHRDVLHALSILSQRLGAQLLFEGIETLDLLENAWRNGAQYYQGFLFSKPQPTLIEAVSSVENLHNQLEKMIQAEIDRQKKHYSFEEELNHLLEQTLPATPFSADYDQYVESICSTLPDHCFRAYVCNRLGYQLSGNHQRQSRGEWTVFHHYRKKNWSWRPYFLKNIVQMELNQRGILSEPYTDHDPNEMIQTFSYPVCEDTYLFIDITLPLADNENKAACH
ncbi:EAL domain-containing protein [Alkalihalobacillus oceani]|uniref:EAL domain-containing protein n=1 Tax=Halalkalibacter oceani TaxID=1653776 RepID=UPI002041E83D|nr:EAL-associated domain-containing protein [Halalkalibacter oceani]MCM3762643.1 EAL domain-containing protein [Halalkalibacter oceani]